jgi:proteic killer suppression protein
MVQIAFQSKLLRAVCEDEAQARRDYDEAVVEALQHRLADLRAASSVRDIIAGRPRTIEGPEGQCMAVDLAGKWRLVFAANHVANPKTESNTCDWAKVTRVKIMRIENFDG